MPRKDTINRFVLQECGDLLGGCLAVPEQPLVRTAELRLERTWLI